MNSVHSIAFKLAALIRAISLSVVLASIANASAQTSPAGNAAGSISPVDWLFERPSPLLPVDRALAIRLASEALQILQSLGPTSNPDDDPWFEVLSLIALNQRAGNTEGLIEAIAMYLKFMERKASWDLTSLYDLEALARRLQQAGHPQLAQRVIRTGLALIERHQSHPGFLDYKKRIYSSFGRSGEEVIASIPAAAQDLSDHCSGIATLMRLGYTKEAFQLTVALGPSRIALDNVCPTSIHAVVLGTGDAQFANLFARAAATGANRDNPSKATAKSEEFVAYAATGLAWRGKFSEAEGLARTVGNSTWRARSGFDIGTAYLHSGRIDDGVRVLLSNDYPPLESIRLRDPMRRDGLSYKVFAVHCFLESIGKRSEATRVLSRHWPDGKSPVTDVYCEQYASVNARAISRLVEKARQKPIGTTARDNRRFLAMQLTHFGFFALGDPVFNNLKLTLDPETRLSSTEW